jgi:ankyrin repeat protein
LNLENSEGFTPLFLAINRNDSQAVDQLLAHGSDPFKLTSSGQNSLHFAAQKGRANMIIIIQAHVAKASGLKKGTRKRHYNTKKSNKRKHKKSYKNSRRQKRRLQ